MFHIKHKVKTGDSQFFLRLYLKLLPIFLLIRDISIETGCLERLCYLNL